ncbi:MAG: phosphatidylserine decarboxylase family protein [Bacteroidota bacterium]|nr:phosphatidylserine decarboxylase family protein [Bacteroidota bacterium]
MFHKEGHKIIIYSFFITFIISISSEYFLTNDYFSKITQIFSLVIFCLVLQFFRNPKRKILKNENEILSPVDGKIVSIKKVYEKEYFKDDRILVSIFMSPFNIHVTRYPVSGKILYSKYHPGKYLVAWHPKSSEKNERTTIVVENKKVGPILYRQIAGTVARRIVNYAKKNTNAIQGEDSGFIKFGSRVDLFLPIDSKIKVKMNQKVKGGINSII